MMDEVVLVVADVELDGKRMEVRRGKKLIPLTTLEFKLLEYLMRNKNSVVTRKDLLVKLWQYSPDIQTRVVDVYIGYLRRKVEGRTEKKLISSVRGLGYIMQDE